MKRAIYFTEIKQKNKDKIEFCVIDLDGFLIMRGKAPLKDKKELFEYVKTKIGLKKIKQVKLSNETYKDFYKKLKKELDGYLKFEAEMDAMEEEIEKEYEKEALKNDINKH